MSPDIPVLFMDKMKIKELSYLLKVIPPRNAQRRGWSGHRD